MSVLQENSIFRAHASEKGYSCKQSSANDQQIISLYRSSCSINLLLLFPAQYSCTNIDSVKSGNIYKIILLKERRIIQ